MKHNNQKFQPTQNYQVDIRNAKQTVCPCGSGLFIQAFRIYTVPAMLSPNGQELLAHQQIFYCKDCGIVVGDPEPVKQEVVSG
jgi:hypothetical protein